MKLQIVSDLHLEFYPLDLPQTEADVIVLAGDIGQHTHGLTWAIETAQAHRKPLLYIIGNHEFYGAEIYGIRAEMQRLAAEARDAGVPVWVLDDSAVELGGVRFLGSTLWTDYQLYGAGQSMGSAMSLAARAMNDHRIVRCAPHSRFMPSQALSFHAESVRWLREMLDTPFDGKTVVITHHLPSEACVAAQYKGDLLSAAFASNCDDLVEKADLWVFGHTHTPIDREVRGRRVLCNPRGYVRAFQGRLNVENRVFDPELVISI